MELRNSGGMEITAPAFGQSGWWARTGLQTRVGGSREMPVCLQAGELPSVPSSAPPVREAGQVACPLCCFPPAPCLAALASQALGSIAVSLLEQLHNVGVRGRWEEDGWAASSAAFILFSNSAAEPVWAPGTQGGHSALA